MSTDNFRLTVRYQRTTKALMGLIDRASDSLDDSRTIARALYAFCEHRDDERLRKALRIMKIKYSR